MCNSILCETHYVQYLIIRLFSSILSSIGYLLVSNMGFISRFSIAMNLIINSVPLSLFASRYRPLYLLFDFLHRLTFLLFCRFSPWLSDTPCYPAAKGRLRVRSWIVKGITVEIHWLFLITRPYSLPNYFWISLKLKID